MYLGCGVGGRQYHELLPLLLDLYITSSAPKGGSVRGLDLGPLQGHGGGQLLHLSSTSQHQESSRINSS